MRGLSKLFFYLVYFFQAETKELRREAFIAAQDYYRKRPLRSNRNPFPRAIEYSQRLQDFQAYQRGYVNTRCHYIAKEKIALKYGE